MAWIKHNLMLVVSGVVGLLLLGGSLYYLYEGLNKNRAVEDEYQEMKSQMNRIVRKDPYPSQENIEAGRDEVAKMKAAVEEAENFFAPLDVKPVVDLQFKSLLDNTIHRLTQKADGASVDLPGDNYAFSFAAQKERLTLNPESFPAINHQLAEVEAICNILLDARIHALTSLKRVRLTSDDPPGSTDYLENRSITTNILTKAVLTPYEVSFTGFSSELASVMDGFLRSPHGFAIRALKVDRFVETPVNNVAPAFVPSTLLKPKPVVVANPNENKTVLNEERFLTTLLITLVKPAPPPPSAASGTSTNGIPKNTP